MGTIDGVFDYWIAVSGDGLIDDPNFTLNVWTSAHCASCLGEDGCIPVAEWRVVSRSSNEDLESPLFLQGEKVTVCINMQYDASETAQDGLHGLIPNFGSGWDMDAFDPTKITVSPGNPVWKDEKDGSCAPFITEQMPYLCTYNDPVTGQLKLCHTGCQSCPCVGPLKEGSPLPSGWFWSTNGGEGCSNDCSPSTHYGIGQVVVNINFCVDLKVRTFTDENECELNRSLSFDFQTTSAGVSGCWNDPIAECKLDFAQFGPKWEIACDRIDTTEHLKKLKQFAYEDINGDEKFDNCDRPLKNCTVSIPALNVSGITNGNGLTTLVIDTGKYEVFYTMNQGLWSQNPLSKILTFDTTFTYKDTIRFQPITQTSVGTINLKSNVLRCDAVITVTLAVVNNSCLALLDGLVSYTFDPRVTITSPLTYDSISGNTLFWFIDSLGPFKKGSILQDIKIPSALSNNDQLSFTAHFISNTGDLLSTSHYSDIIRCSYDPNDKLMSPNRDGAENYLIPDDTITYTIRFQNTGNDTAYHVRVVDTLDQNIDINSLQLVYSSHDVEISIKDHIVIFDFENIYLPDTAKGQDVSQGFVTFSVKTDSTITNGMKILNNANIYFDNNLPIITNTIINTFVEKLPCPLDVIFIDENLIKVNASVKTYRWYRCDDKKLMAETTIPHFKPIASGKYYAEIDGYFCTSTTDCIDYLLPECPDRPSNDDPDPTSSHPPHILASGATHVGTTCCAIGFADSPILDLPNFACSSATHDGAVWYRYTTGTEKGFQINVWGQNLVGNTTVEILSGDTLAPDTVLFQPHTFSCSQLPITLKVGCYGPGEEVWIKIASTDLDCGIFRINLEEIDQCPLADECGDATEVYLTNTTDPGCGDFTPIVIDGCLEAACPETQISVCGSNTLPTVWFHVRVDTAAVQLGSSISASGSWGPVWAIYSGGCGSLSLLSGGTIAEPTPCSNDDQNGDVHSVGTVEGVLDYWIAVSGEGFIDDPNFTLNVWTSALCVACIGEDGCEPQAEWYVSSRSSTLPLDDPHFYQGEAVTVCIEYLYDASETGVDWLHGLIPNFGSGWDMDAFDPSQVEISPGAPVWSDETDGPCAPFINEQMPYLCTYVDSITGKLKLCHTGCQACPCNGPLLSGQPLPSGWFWSTNGSGGCLNDCSPSTHYGIGQVVVNINFCVDLKVRVFDNESDCARQGNLSFDFQTTSDGVSGCWNDPIAECKLDFAQIGPKWEVLCDSILNANEDLSSHFALYPNPANLDLNTESEEVITSLIIFDIQGRQVKRVVFDDANLQRKISLEGFTDGLYVAKLITDSGSYYKTFIVIM